MEALGRLRLIGMKTLTVAGAIGVSLATTACDHSPDAADTASSEDGLTSGPSETCGTGSVAATLTANGTVRSGTNYNPSDCFRAYKVDVNNYSPGELGALVAYGSAAPTNEQECTRTSLRVYVWRRNANGTSTFMNNAIRKGTWVSDGLGGMRCAAPNVDLSTFFTPGELPRGGNYRIAARASVLPPPGSTTEVYKQVYVSVPPGIPVAGPSRIVNAMTNLGATLSSAGSTINADVQKVWNLRNASAGVRGSICRSWELQLTMMRANALTLKRVVPAAQAATVDVRASSAEQIYTLICNTPNPAASAQQSLQTAMRNHMQWPNTIRTQVASFLSSSLEEAGQLMAQSANLDYQRLMTRCGASMSEMTNYIALGTRPAGMVGANPLLRNCSGSVTTIAASAGIGVSTTNDPRTKYRACIDKQTANLVPSCAGPRSNEPADADPADKPTDFDGPCKQGEAWNADTDACVPENERLPGETPVQSEAERTKTYVAALEAYEESTRRAEKLARDSKIEGFAGAAFGLLGAVPGFQAFLVPAGVGLTGAFVLDQAADHSRAKAKEYREIICKLDPGNAEVCGAGNRCAEYNLLGDRVWAQTSPTPFSPDGRQTTQGERLDDCMCQLFDKDYGRTSGFEFGGASPFCPDSHDRLVEDCLRNPEIITPTDQRKPRPECMAILYPKEVDRVSMVSRWCHAMMPNCEGAYLDDQGACACPGGGNGFPAAGAPACVGANATDCGPDAYLDEKNCVCVPYDAGLGCERGGLSGYLARNPGDVFTATFPKETAISRKNYLMFASGNTPVASRKILSTGLSTSMTEIKLATRLPATTLSSGYQGWAVQLSCTNTGNNVQNRNLGTKQLQSLSAGANTLTYALTAADRAACFNGDKTPVRFEIRSNNQAGQPRIGFEDLSVTNLIDDLPGLPDPCSPPTPGPLPDPIPVSLPPSLTLDGLFGQTDWRFSEGTLVRFPVIR